MPPIIQPWRHNYKKSCIISIRLTIGSYGPMDNKHTTNRIGLRVDAPESQTYRCCYTMKHRYEIWPKVKPVFHSLAAYRWRTKKLHRGIGSNVVLKFAP